MFVGDSGHQPSLTIVPPGVIPFERIPLFLTPLLNYSRESPVTVFLRVSTQNRFLTGSQYQRKSNLLSFQFGLIKSNRDLGVSVFRVMYCDKLMFVCSQREGKCQNFL